jgi:N-carbamoylputrescine amidase
VNVTVCQFHDNGVALERDWEYLCEYSRAAKSELILLPDMPFYPWLARSPHYHAAVWEAAVTAHDVWERRFPDLAPAMIAATRPVYFGNERYNEGFIWSPKNGMRGVHAKTFLENREKSWEATWYRSAVAEFVPIEMDAAVVGFLIGAELYVRDAVEQYARQHVPLLLMPRSTPASELDRWLSGAREVALLTHAFAVSSNRASDGGGWIINPDGETVALTRQAHPFVTVDLESAAIQPSAG